MLLKVVGINSLTSKMNQRKLRLDDRSKLNARAIVVLDRWIQKNFDTEGQLAVGGWQPLSPSTLLARAKGWGNYKHHKSASPKILQDTGKLKTNWKHYYDKRRAWIRAGVIYAVTHQEGLGNVPRRPLIPTKKQIMPALKKIYGEFIRTNLK